MRGENEKNKEEEENKSMKMDEKRNNIFGSSG